MIKEKIKRILHKYAKEKVNLHSETAREIVATEIIEILDEVKEDIQQALDLSHEQLNNPKGRRLDKDYLLEKRLVKALNKLEEEKRRRI